MVNRPFEILPTVAVALGVPMFLSENAAAKYVTEAGDICSVVPEKFSSRRDAKLDSIRMVTLEGDLGRTHHLGVIITDDKCGDRFVRIVIPIPDERNLSAKFQEFYKKSFGSVVTHFSCTCSGQLKFTKGIPILTLENAQVLEHVDRQ